jgi:hypothetical protein
MNSSRSFGPFCGERRRLVEANALPNMRRRSTGTSAPPALVRIDFGLAVGHETAGPTRQGGRFPGHIRRVHRPSSPPPPFDSFSALFSIPWGLQRGSRRREHLAVPFECADACLAWSTAAVTFGDGIFAGFRTRKAWRTAWFGMWPCRPPARVRGPSDTSHHSPPTLFALLPHRCDAEAQPHALTSSSSSASLDARPCNRPSFIGGTKQIQIHDDVAAGRAHVRPAHIGRAFASRTSPARSRCGADPTGVLRRRTRGLMLPQAS